MLSFGNTKLKKDGIASFGHLAIETCPGSNKCKQGCYASRGEIRLPCVMYKHLENTFLTMFDDFSEIIINEIESKRVKILRIHDSGDFYSVKYCRDWVRIASRCPSIQFYAYTKSIKHWRQIGILPDNLRLIFSYGGKEDHLILKTDKQCHVVNFFDVPKLEKQGYVYGNNSDLIALNHDKIVLSYHGVCSKSDKNRFVTI